jgi:hypothetical protein
LLFVGIGKDLRDNHMNMLGQGDIC